MRIVVFSDVHGNMDAFEKIYEDMERQNVDLYIFCGDVCGYYYNQNEIIDIFRSMDNLICVLGNHDDFFLKALENSMLEMKYTKKYGKSIKELKRNISKENLAYLKNIDTKKELLISGYSFGIFHGNPWDYLNGYVYPDTPLDQFKSLPYDYILLGHTHYQMVRTIDNKKIINPGSCGQPRDGKLPSYCIVDLTNNEVEFRTIDYNINNLIKDIKKNKESNKYLTDILYRSRGRGV